MITLFTLTLHTIHSDLSAVVCVKDIYFILKYINYRSESQGIDVLSVCTNQCNIEYVFLWVFCLTSG